ncbi:MAG: imidazoleglycerol-phosphate dehydratase HisB [Spirochaetaceae bacterium]|nr:MAG: imidazoleglycerol-phosphate dehydratase HisB [Spirochaetaceae bacterium]
MRRLETTRTTRETDIRAAITLPETFPLEADASAAQSVRVETHIPFFDHMLQAFFFHGGFSAEITARGDTDVDDHHTVEDVGIVIGSLLARVTDEYGPVRRFGHALVPMDDSLGEVVVDACGRSFLVYQVEYPQTHAGRFDLALVREFFTGLSANARANVHVIGRYGLNGHHLAESVFKAAGRALGAAYTPAGTVLSTKGVL